MDESKAISPEIKGLFETIKKQAIEYSKAFEFFEETRQRIIQTQSELEDFAKHLSKDIDERFHLLEDTINEFIADFQQKNSTIENVFKELSRIENLKNDLERMHSELKVQMLKVDNLLKTLENKMEMEFETFSQSLTDKFKDQVESTLKMLEVKYALKFKSIDEKISNFDQKLLNQTVSQSRFSKIAYDEIDTLKEKLEQFRQILYEERQRIEARFGEFSEELNKKFIKLDQILNQFEQQTQTTLQNSESSSEKFRDELKTVFQQLNEIRNQQYKIDTKFKNILIIVSVMFILVLLVVFILK